jgi:hypothetical protein
MKSMAVHEEVPKEEAAVKSFGTLKKLHRGQHLAIGCFEKPKEWTQDNGGCPKK